MTILIQILAATAGTVAFGGLFGVPGRYCPDSAAEALERAVKAVIDRERGCEQ